MQINNNKAHSSGWIAQSWISFVFAITATTIGIVYVPLDAWAKGYLAISFAFTVSSTISISKTTRDLHEGRRLVARVDEAHIERILAEHHPLK
ncbi:MAG: hypothetical protein HC886_16450 [Leptolyngbyaceae cyanobacterium SM1_1_3]|nr:hypothetical protein [Leptolyngbyaceae cyanobacterium SM1_1_3]NJM85099.1 hypothetical protein [Leptolyngbyaceae cyanobacterium RM2_2_21]NJN02141.1 hypothetical protein [Leptolyngbyaceae cyanobacterium RM1_1_2]NJO08976.1 hypothetical protein [Leptolyngbyaceae cyanobacterium SL_1_1]